MSRLLRNFLHLEEGEEGKIAQLALIGLLLQAGLTMGMNGADSLFLVKAGADKLPRIYLAMPVIMLIYIPVYSALMTRWGLDRIFDATLALLVVGGVALWVAMNHVGAFALPFAYAAKLYAAVWYVGLYTLYWNFIDEYFNLFDAKRLFALLAAGSAVGAILGGTLVGPITAHFGVPALFLSWAILTAAAWPVALWTRRRFHKLEDEESAAETSTGWSESLGLVSKLLHNRYALVLALSFFFTLIAATTCEFQYLTIFSTGRDEAQIATLLGHLSAMANLFNLAVSLLVFNKLVAKLGVRNVAIIQSVAYAVVFSWLLLDGGFPAAVAGFFAYQGLMTSIDFNNANLLFAGLPADSNKQMRTIIEGICEPLATASAGIFLLLVAPRLSPEQIALAGVVVALVGLGLVFVLRYDYVAAIGANLRRDWLDLSRPSEPLLRTASAGDLDLVETRAGTAGPEEAAVALRVLWLNAPLRGVRALLAFVRRAPAGSQLPVKLLLDEALARPDSADAREIQRWLDEYDSDPDAEFPDADLAGELGRHRLLSSRRTEALLRLGGPEARGAAAVALWQSWRVPENSQALRHVAELLAAGDERSTLAGVHTLGWLGEARYAYLLRDYLRSPSPRIRKTALNALRAMADPSSGILLPEILAVVAETTGEERLFALEAFERIGDATALAALLACVNSFTPAERRRTGQLILHLGQSSVPILIEIAQNNLFVPAGRSVALRALGKLALPQMQLLATPLVAQMALRAYAVLTSYMALTKTGAESDEAGHAVLVLRCREYAAGMLDLMLETLAVAGRLPSFEALVVALGAGASKDRGYAIETVEQACDRATFALLLPLIDGRPIAEQVAYALAQGFVTEQDAHTVLVETLERSYPLATAAAAQALLATGDPADTERALARLTQRPDPLLAETILTCLDRRGGTVAAAPLTPVEVARALIAAPDFSACLYRNFEFLVPRVQQVGVPAGTVLCLAGAPLPGLWLILGGAVEVAGRSALLGPGAVAGAEALLGVPLAPATLTAVGEVTALFLSAAVLRRCAEIYPELALALLAQKIAA
jgi:HEAT repeat protein/Na+/melibiose symporter-like transporter